MSSHHRKRSLSPPSHPSKKPIQNPNPNPNPNFLSYLDSPSLPHHLHLLCRLLSTTNPSSLPSLLSSISLPPLSSSDVESVLKLSYSHPSSALAFFRFAATSTSPSPLSSYSWNLVVDLLGKNRLFPPMWEAIRSMPSPSLATFASVFSSYAEAADFPSALQAFDEMHSLYGVPRDAAALNSLLSAVCRVGGRTVVARDFLRMKRHEVRPDGDSYAILMEGWESEGDARRARETFDDMVDRVGWDPKNVAAFDSFLCVIMKGSGGLKEVIKYVGLLKERRCYPGKKFFRSVMEEFARVEDAKGASSVWESLVGRNGCYPDKEMYGLMIKLQCYDSQTEAAQRYLDEMVMYGVFPDGKIYNVVLQYLLKGRRLREATAIFNEIVKNEVCPSESNCNSAIKVFLDAGDWEMSIKVWKCMVENGYSAEECGNMLVGKLKDIDRLPEACRFAEDMIDRRVKLNSANLSKLRTSLLKIGKGSIYDHILRKWKLH